MRYEICHKLAIAFVGLNALDAFLTLKILEQNGTELMPLARTVIEQPLLFWSFKIGGSTLAAYLVLRLNNRKFRSASILGILVMVMVGICMFNLVGMLT